MTLRQARNRRAPRQRYSRLRRRPAADCARCADLEHLLHEDIGQQLTGIALLLAAARRAPMSPAEFNQALANINDLLLNAIGRCRRDSLGY